eukprot:Plantae.Rhodophyta-Rhodochaete_pulchella.ctg22730.p1 GENE.Plantae.Rhodophyta-Rhodochaete_pulchella.ctg22730~~Plantae.Rhodophyta-Rhodochaete_pulchella.ctg22730.p1  ORF type:complete len:595 (+),score=98.16 Plantae.Rhodophyta-Rhodochaete_pulchella.ctg22730:137-1786(+)
MNNSFPALGDTNTLTSLLRPWFENKKTVDVGESRVPDPGVYFRNVFDNIQGNVYAAMGVGDPLVKLPQGPNRFELRDAIFCAGFAFEAYNDPVGGTIMQGEDGCDIHFLSAAVVSEQFKVLLVGAILGVDAPNSTTFTYNVKFGPLGKRGVKEGKGAFFLYVLPQDAEADPLKPLVIEVERDGKVFARGEYQLTEFPESLLQLEVRVAEVDNPTKTFNVRFEIGSFELNPDAVSKAPPTFGDDDEDDMPISDEERQLRNLSTLQSRQWDVLSRAASRFGVSFKDVERVCFVSHPLIDTQVSVWRSRKLKCLILAFRGTEQAKWQDFLTDSLMILQPFEPAKEVDLSVEAYSRGTSEFNGTRSKVHYGFLRAYTSVRETVTNVVQALLSQVDEEYTIWQTGHSLGGALANLCAVDLAPQLEGIRGQIVYTFGAPRVGNAAFANLANETVPECYRVVNDADVVARMPRSDFHHSGRTVLVGKNREVWVDEEGEEVRALQNRWSSLDELWEAEREIMQSLVSGRSLDDHMEDSYFLAVVEAHRKLQEEATDV